MLTPWATVIRTLEYLLPGSKRPPDDPGAISLACDAIRGSLYEQKWRGDTSPDLPPAIRRAIERLSLIDEDVHPIEFSTDHRLSLGVGWGTYRWRGDPACLRAAIDGGAVLIDTAATYGYGRVEKALGAAGLRDRGATWIATKFARNHARRASVLASLERSLANLRVDTIDLFQLHWPVTTVPFEETLGAMYQALVDGTVRSLGLCNVSVDQLHVARRYAPISCVQVRLNVKDPLALGPLSDYCNEAGIRLIAHSPFGQGESPRRDLSWFLERNFIPIPGSNNPDHIRENLRASL